MKIKIIRVKVRVRVRVRKIVDNIGNIVVWTGAIVAEPPGRISALRPPPSSAGEKNAFYHLQNVSHLTPLHYQTRHHSTT